MTQNYVLKYLNIYLTGCLLLCSILGWAQTFTTLAEDNANNYGSDWAGNGGNNFQSWVFQNNPDGGFAGKFLEINANGASPAISSNNKSFGTFANSGTFPRVTAFRGFTENLKAGDVFTVEIQHSGITNGGSVGLTLRSGNTTDNADNYNTDSRFEVAFIGGSSNYSIFANSTTDTGVEFTSGGIRIKVTILDLNTVNVELTVLGTNTTTTFNNIVLGGVSNSEIESFALFNRNAREANVYFNNIKVERPTFTTIADGNYNNAGTWANDDIPNGTGRVVINHEVTLSATDALVATDLEWGTDGNLILNSVSNDYSSLVVDNVIGTGTITYNRHVNDFDDTDATTAANSNDLVSSPTAIADVATFLSGNSNLLNNNATSPDPIIYAFAPFNNDTGLYENLNSDATGALIADTGTPLFPRGTGFRAATTDPNETLSFTGTIATTTVNKTISVGDANNGTAAWNLIGNPFPSYLDFATFFDVNSAEFDTNAQAIYGYNATTSRWTIWNQATIDDTSVTEYIAPGQGFFVKSKAEGGTVSFTPEMRTTSGGDDFIDGRSANNVSVAKANINLETEGKNFNTVIYFNSNATRNMDPGYDASAYLGNASGIFTHLVEGNTGTELAVQTLGYDDFNEVTIPLGIKSNNGDAITISLGNNNTLPESVNVYLEDTANGTFTLLNNNSYQVTPESALNGTGRFFLRFTSGTLGIGDDTAGSLNIYQDVAAQNIVIAGQLNNNTTAYIYDLQGRMVLNQALQAGNIQQSINVSSLHTGIYIVKIGEQITRKVILR